MHFLVADPNAAFAALLSEELERLGHDVTTCGSGVEVLTSAQERMPDLALLDMALDGPAALTVAQRLRALDPQVRLMLIPLMGEEPKVDPSAPSIQGVLPKPFFLPELPERIEAALNAPLNGDLERGEDPAAVQAVARTREPVSEPETIDVEEAAANAAVANAVAANAVAAGAVDSNTVANDAVAGKSAVPEPSAVKPRLSRAAFERHRSRIERLMRDLCDEVGADATLITSSDEGVLAAVGRLDDDGVASIARMVVNGWQASAEVARMLGNEQLRFEQSIAGGSYILYAISVHDVIMAVTIRGTAPLGLLRHRARATAERIAGLCAA